MKLDPSSHVILRADFLSLLLILILILFLSCSPPSLGRLCDGV
jgi:hypothetical protein